MSKSFVLKPRMSEKAYALSQVEDTYVFMVPKNANKATVATAVEEQFNVTVTDVRVVVSKGKRKLSYQKRNRPVDGKRADSKKAYVRVKKGDKIPIFSALEEDEQKAEKAAKKEKK